MMDASAASGGLDELNIAAGPRCLTLRLQRLTVNAMPPPPS
ncbi:MAG: hypothetical protein R3E66_12140 [bacterium]